ncbi:MAG: hypothetical protein M0Z33_02070 [Actinomycetota bacterium]|nr:hypothetical protein [Actinomycetota bacterium]
MRTDAITDVERPWVELVERVGERTVRDELLVRGVTAAKAAGIAMWLGDQLDRRRNCDEATAWRYRRVLEGLGELPRFPVISRRAIPG